MSVIITLPGGGGAQADWNATSGESQILNKPTLGTAAGADIQDFVAAATIANYETTTQLNARDTANRNRTNHTGTQLASTISDLGSAVSANADVAANTAARHVPVTVTNSGEIGLTLAGQNITASLVNGSIASARLDSAVNTSLSLANSSVQPGTLSNYETTTQLNSRDTANRSRANHTGTQLAATISDIGATISANADVAANTAARHAAVTVTDSSEIDFTLTGQNITASLVNGSIGATRLSAGVNTSLGLANSALQPNQANDGQIVNGVAHFVRNTTPTVRVDGSALVVGDRWYNSSTGDQWFWNGTYWLSQNISWTAGRRSSSTGAPNYTEATEWNYAMGQQAFVSMVNYGCTLATAGDANNYYNFSVRAVLRDNTTSTVYTSSVKLFASGSNVVSSESASVLIPVTIGGIRVVGLSSQFVAVGTPPTISHIAHSIGWRLAL